MERRTGWVILGLIGLFLVSSASAETDFMEVAPPAGLYFQYFQLYQHYQDWPRDDLALGDTDIDAAVSLFRIAKWWDNGVAHIVVPVGWASQEARAQNGMMLWDGHECGLGDIVIGGGPRWINEAKDTFFVAGSDFRLPTGDYCSHDDATCDSWEPFGQFNFGSGSLSVQPFMILTKLFEGGLIASDTELRYDINTEAGPIQYDPDDKLELWQNVSIGLAPNFRLGAVFKGEFEINDDDDNNDHSVYMGVGPGMMLMLGDVVIWSKVLFDAYTNDNPEDSVTAYLRVSIPF